MNNAPVAVGEVGRRLADAGLQIASTALHHDLELVSGKLRHCERITDLRLSRGLADC
jgi:predicted nucleic acid-binding protein